MTLHTKNAVATPTPTVSPAVHTTYYFYEDI
jgi:hypothetical protein